MTAVDWSLENFLTRGWSGREKLSTIFWHRYLLFQVGGLLLLWLIEMELLHLQFYPAFQTVIAALVVLIDAAWWGFLIVYGLWCWVALWRCAFNVKHKIWGYLARIYVVAAVVSAVGTVFT